MTPPRLLDGELLAQFESAVRAKGINLDTLTPGLTDIEIDRIVEPWGLQLPEEVRTWWRWHNGGPVGTSVYLLPHRAMLNLKEAIGSHVHHVELGRAEYADPKGGIQPVDWTPEIFVQCVTSGDVPAPVYVVHEPAAPSRLALASLGELVLTWIDYIERGVYASNPEGGWHDIQDYPADVLALGVR